MLIHPGLGVVCAAFILSYPQLQTSLPLRLLPAYFPLTFRLLWKDYPRLFPPLVTLVYPSFVSYPCPIPTSPRQRSGSPLSQLRLAQDHYTCASPYDTGMGRGDEVEGGVVLLIFYTFVRL